MPIGTRYGRVEVISDEAKVRRGKERWRRYEYVQARCVECGTSGWVLLSNLQTGKTSGCRLCTSSENAPRYPEWLGNRLTVIKQRCENPNNPRYKDYGGRGIRFGWPGIKEAADWIMANIHPLDKSLQFDRIDNDKGYEPGNLRMVSGYDNAQNRQNSVLPYWDQSEWPFARNVVTRKLKSGMTRDEIIENAHQIVEERGSHWRHVKQKLESMTS